MDGDLYGGADAPATETHQEHTSGQWVTLGEAAREVLKALCELVPANSNAEGVDP
jgi:hypothetical protein